MRLFAAVDLPDEIIAALESLSRHLRPTAKIQWSAAGNFHITTKFIGEWPEERLGELKGKLATLPPREPFAVEVRGLGFFPDARAPRVFWAGVRASPDLATLARATDQAAAGLGIPAEIRAFSPHLTLARIRDRSPLEQLHEAIRNLSSHDFGRFTADRFFLYQSRLASGGSVYTKLSEFPFSTQ